MSKYILFEGKVKEFFVDSASNSLNNPFKRGYVNLEIDHEQKEQYMLDVHADAICESPECALTNNVVVPTPQQSTKLWIVTQKCPPKTNAKYCVSAFYAGYLNTKFYTDIRSFDEIKLHSKVWGCRQRNGIWTSIAVNTCDLFETEKEATKACELLHISDMV